MKSFKCGLEADGESGKCLKSLRNEEVLNMVDEERCLLQIIQKRKRNGLECVLKGIDLAATILVETVKRKKRKEAKNKYGGRHKK